MKRFLCLPFLLIAWLARGATGDITGGFVSTNGWDLYLFISGLTTNGTYALGNGTNDSQTITSAVTMAWTESGFLNAAETTWPRGNYATEQVQKPLDGEFYYDEIEAGGVLMLRLALAHQICVGSSNLTLTALAGFYHAGGASNNPVSGLAITNSSAQPYPSTIVNRENHGWEHWTNSVHEFVVSAGHALGPIDCVEVFATDVAGTIITNQVSRPMRDGAYHAFLNITTLSNQQLARIDYRAVPKYGDTNAIFDTRRNIYTGHTPLPVSVTNLIDHLRTVTNTIAMVDVSGTGSDAAGIPTNGTPDQVNSGHWFSTAAKAALACTQTNQYAVANVYLRAGEYNGLGSAQTFASRPKTLVRFWAYGGQVIFTNVFSSGGDLDMNGCDRMWFGPGIEFRGAGSMFAGTELLVFDGLSAPASMIISNAHASALAQNCNVIWARNCTLNRVPEGVQGFSTQNTGWMVKDVDLTHFANTGGNNFGARFCVGAYRTDRSDMTIQPDYSTSTTPPPIEMLIYRRSYFSGLFGATAVFQLGGALPIWKGAYFENVIFEGCTNSIASSFSICTKTNINYTNVVFRGCTFVGSRVAGFFYQDVGTETFWRVGCVVQDCVIDNGGWKTWNFGTTNVARIGNLGLMYNADCRNNFHIECLTASGFGAGSFNPFVAPHSYHPPGNVDTAETNTVDYPQFVDRRSQGESTSPPRGNGNYKFKSNSPAFQIRVGTGNRFVDFDGIPLATSPGFDPPGPYASGNVKKGAFF